jgi:hypothetical protein
MKVLVIFDVIPEETQQAVVEMTESEYKFFSKAHGHIMGATDDTVTIAAATVISYAFLTDVEDCDSCETDKEREYCGAWKSEKSTGDISDVDKIIQTGIYL